MATTLQPLSSADLAAEFARLADRWTAQTEHLSNPNQRILHRDYQRIIGLGLDVVPHLLRRLKADPDDWFWALSAVTGQDPIDPAHAGKLDLMTRDWLNWGRDHGIDV